MPTAAELRAGGAKKTPAKKATAKKADPPKKEGAVKAAELDEVEDLGPAPSGATLLEGLGASLADEVTTINGLWYGDNGTGKTCAVSAMAKLGKVIVVRAEGGVKVRPLRELGIPIENITLWPRESATRVSYVTLDDLYWSIKSMLDSDPKAIVGVIWDSLSEIATTLLDQVVAADVEKAERQQKARDPFLVELGNYQTMAQQVRPLLRHFRDLPCHFVMTALPRRDQDDDGRVIYNPAVTPAIRNDVMGMVDIICHTSTAEVDGQEEYRGLFTPTPKYHGKDRFGALPDRLIDPSFDRVLAYVEDELTFDTDPVMAEGKARRERLAEKTAAKATADAGLPDKKKEQ